MNIVKQYICRYCALLSSSVEVSEASFKIVCMLHIIKLTNSTARKNIGRIGATV